MNGVAGRISSAIMALFHTFLWVLDGVGEGKDKLEIGDGAMAMIFHG